MARELDKIAVEQPRPITHVGVTVTDIDAAIDWYRRVLGFQLLHGPVEYTAGEEYFGQLVADMLGPKVVRGRIAMLDTGNSASLELFEFSEPKADRRGTEENQEFYLRKTGTFHFCVVDPDTEGLARRIVENGGSAARFGSLRPASVSTSVTARTRSATSSRSTPTVRPTSGARWRR